jgi:hypothetical protein
MRSSVAVALWATHRLFLSDASLTLRTAKRLQKIGYRTLNDSGH